MDVLSEILKSLKMRHTAVGTLALGARWGLRIEGFDAPTAYGLARGESCWLMLPGRNPLLLAEGDIALLTHAPYCIASSPDEHCADFGVAWNANQLPPFDPNSEPGIPLRFSWGQGGATTHLLGLAFGLFDGRRNPILQALPQVIVLRKAHGSAFPWIQPAIDFLSTQDGGSPGFAATARAMAELVFVSIVRSHLNEHADSHQGWIRGLGDPGIARALQAIHRDPGTRWTVESLAQEAGLSRTSLATRFAELVQTTPIDYLTQWRMHLAAERILDSNPNLTQLAFELGYASDAAFRDAFKRRYGVSPSRYRDRSGRSSQHASSHEREPG